MIDIKILRTNPELIRDSITKRNLSLNLDRLLELDSLRLEIQKKLNDLQALRNKTSKEIPAIKDPIEKQELMASMRLVGENISGLEKELTTSDEEYYGLLYSVPNFLSPTAAIGKTDDENVVVSKFSEPTKFSFPIKTHSEIGIARGWIDIEKGADVSGARFWYLKGDLVLLQFAIMNYVMAKMGEKGFMPIIPPYLVREKAMFGTGFFPAEKGQIYNVNP